MKLKLKKKSRPVTALPDEGTATSPAKKAKQDVEALGLGGFVRPKGLDEDRLRTRFSIKLADVEDHELGRLHASYTSLACYAGSMAAEAENDLLEATTLMDAIRDVIMLDVGNMEKQHICKARANTHPKFIEAQAKYIHAQSRYTHIRSSVDNYNRCAAAVSREITRRQNELPNIKRQENIG